MEMAHDYDKDAQAREDARKAKAAAVARLQAANAATAKVAAAKPAAPKVAEVAKTWPRWQFNDTGHGMLLNSPAHAKENSAYANETPGYDTAPAAALAHPVMRGAMTGTQQYGLGPQQGFTDAQGQRLTPQQVEQMQTYLGSPGASQSGLLEAFGGDAGAMTRAINQYSSSGVNYDPAAIANAGRASGAIKPAASAEQGYIDQGFGIRDSTGQFQWTQAGLNIHATAPAPVPVTTAPIKKG
jgi:hypothetical protein